jgi:NADH dehydrogenase
MIGRRAVAALSRGSPEVRAHVRRREAAPALRDLGVKVAVGWIGDVDTLSAVMRGAHTVCHLVGGLDMPDEAAYEEANLSSVRWALEAASKAGVRRFLFLSYPGASPGSANPYLRYKGLAEEAIRASGLEYVVLRSTHVYGPGSEWLEETARQAARRPSIVLGSGHQVLAPVFVDDVVAVLVAADDRDAPLQGVWGLEGPDRVTADELADLLSGRRRPRLHVSPGTARRATRLSAKRRSAAALEVLAGESVADAPDAARAFGIRRTPLSEGLRRSGPGHGSAAVLEG